MEERYFYAPGCKHPIDTAILREDGKTVTGAYSNKTLSELEPEYPGIKICTWEEVAAGMEAASKTPWKEISKKRFWYLLEVLPPQDWHRTAACETFKMSERTNGRVTGIVARRFMQYFYCEDLCTLTHDQIMDSLQAHLDSQRSANLKGKKP